MNRTTRKAGFRLAILGAAVCLAIPGAVAQLTNIETFDYPGAVSTSIYSVNDAGDLAGGYFLPYQKRHGFLFRRGEFTTIDFPGAAGTTVFRTNVRGDVGGTYTDTSNKQ